MPKIPFKEKIHTTRTMFAGHKITVEELDIEVAQGEFVTWERAVIGMGAGVIPVDAEGNVYLIREYNIGVEERVLLAPKGFIDEEETPVQAVLREMAEEVALNKETAITTSPENVHFLSEMMQNTTYCKAGITMHLATDVVPCARQKGDELHYIKLVKMPLDNALAMCMNGKIYVPILIASLFMARELLVQMGKYPFK